MILNTGLFGNIEQNENTPISEANWYWSLIDENGNKVQLADFKGQKIFINTWATWCPPCNAEMPGIIELKNELGDEGRILVRASGTEPLVRVMVEAANESLAHSTAETLALALIAVHGGSIEGKH